MPRETAYGHCMESRCGRLFQWTRIRLRARKCPECGSDQLEDASERQAEQAAAGVVAVRIVRRSNS
jgi:predicted  nucleic acid-binding Zn-ribbon protein